jgi:hypothetical protein
MLSRPVSGGKSNHDQSPPWWFPPELSQMIRCQAEYNRAVQIITKAARVPETIYAMLRSTSTPTATTTSTTAPTATADPGPAPPTPSTSPTSKPPTRKRRSSLNSAAINLVVADWLRQHATDPFAVRIREVARAVGVSLGAVASSPAWRAFESRRRELRPKAKREVPLVDELLAVLPARDRTDELEQLIREQEADRRRDERRSRRSGRCS